MRRRLPASTLFPYTTLFRSRARAVDGIRSDGIPPSGRHRGEVHEPARRRDRKSTRLNSSHANISYAVFCLKKKKGNPGACLPLEVVAPPEQRGERDAGDPAP